MANSSHASVQTAATGTNFATFASSECVQLEINNQSGTTIEVRRDGAGVAIPILNGDGLSCKNITNANQIGVRRVDTANTQVTVYAILDA